LDPLRVALGAKDAGGRELEDPTEQRAGLRVLADAFDNPNAVGLVAVPVNLTQTSSPRAASSAARRSRKPLKIRASPQT